MNSTRDPLGFKAFPSLRRSFLRGGLKARAAALGACAGRDYEARYPRPISRLPGREHEGLELRTEAFREELARKHRVRVAEVNARRDLAVEEWTDVLTGAAPPMPCANATWRTGTKKPPRKNARCGAVTKQNGIGQRCAMHVGHEGEHRISRARVCCACPICVMHDAETSRLWHEARKEGQRARFDHVRSCGSRMMIAGCSVCGDERRAVPEGCGVRRVCKRCDTRGALKRRARFGRARGRTFIKGHRYGLSRRKMRGGRYTEKMVTLTAPHFDLAEASGEVGEQPDTLRARVAAVFAAWPRFQRKVNRHWRSCGHVADHVVYHRAFEWTPGRSDEHGHPHFHVYLWSPFLDRNLIREWWAEALREVGVPVAVDEDGCAIVSTRIQMLRSNGISEVRELMKGGQRSALTLSRVEFADPSQGREMIRRGYRAGAPGIDAFAYAEGWTLGDVEGCSDDVRARLYMALEGRRLTQASSGFFLDDEPCRCVTCGATAFRARFQGEGGAVALPVAIRPPVRAGPPRAPFPWETGQGGPGSPRLNGGIDR